MPSSPTSPKIESISWGRVVVEGARTFKDVKLFPGGAREWDWRETGTQHVPGIQPADVEELIEHGATVIVLSRGMQLQLEVRPETLRHLEERGIEVQILESKAAAEAYNSLRERHPVGALLHSTC
jgi:hypothetical protein